MALHVVLVADVILEPDGFPALSENFLLLLFLTPQSER